MGVGYRLLTPAFDVERAPGGLEYGPVHARGCPASIRVRYDDREQDNAPMVCQSGRPGGQREDLLAEGRCSGVE